MAKIISLVQPSPPSIDTVPVVIPSVPVTSDAFEAASLPVVDTETKTVTDEITVPIADDIVDTDSADWGQ